MVWSSEVELGTRRSRGTPPALFYLRRAMRTADCASVPACLLFLGFSSTGVFLHRYLCSQEDAAIMLF